MAVKAPVMRLSVRMTILVTSAVTSLATLNSNKATPPCQVSESTGGLIERHLAVDGLNARLNLAIRGGLALEAQPDRLDAVGRL